MKQEAQRKVEEEIVRKARMLIPAEAVRNDKVVERLHCYKKIYNLKNKVRQITAIDV